MRNSQIFCSSLLFVLAYEILLQSQVNGEHKSVSLEDYKAYNYRMSDSAIGYQDPCPKFVFLFHYISTKQ